MEQAIVKAAALVEAMEYIRLFRGKIVLVKLGGSVLDDAELQKKLLTDVVFMATVGIHPVIVHGGGKAITRAMESSGLETQWVEGRRYTDERAMAVVEHTLVNQINKTMCEMISELGVEAMGLHSLSSCVLFAEPLRLTDKAGRKIDLGQVGQVQSINASLIKKLCASGIIPVIAPVAIDKSGGKLNVNADTVAGKVAAAVGAEKFVSVSDTHGIRGDVNDPDSRISSITEEEIRKFIASGVIGSGMLPKVEACIAALDGGVRKAHIIDGRIPHSLLLEIYTEAGIGTQIIK
ncbi:MAG: acetylglutamate kinase [Anaerohalosphaeraceae bacterium]|nr:acetylglutamate kinase [Anaerohalosphaeraceae bacterium]